MDSEAGNGTPGYVEIIHPWFSNELMPIYRWTFPSAATDEQLTACLRAREELARHVRYDMAWIIDMSHIEEAPAIQRKAVAEHLQRFDADCGRRNAGSALIVPNAWLRGLVTAVTWISAPRFPIRLFSEPVEAERWAKRQLAARLDARG